jgi:ABC-type Fe3+/spermidine/putrescine transport system ATPase subunit
MSSQPLAPDRQPLPSAASAAPGVAGRPDAGPSAAALQIERVSKRFHGHLAVDDVSLAIRQGELVTILGPSGCGKTTLLRMVAGLLDPDAGRIALGSRVIADPAARVVVPVEKRGIGLVFQDYALWPHLTVRQHLGFALELRRIKGRQAAARTEELLRLVRLDGLADRLPSQLSGGQQQRVALARALAADAQLLLLDEPLSNLDARLRQAMRDELQTLLRAAGSTAVAVTHDQADALAISDRVVVMSAGRVLQQDTPQEVFERPATSTVAHFLGSGSLVPGEIVGPAGADGLATFRPRGSEQTVQARAIATAGPLVAVIPNAAPPGVYGTPDGTGAAPAAGPSGPLTTLAGTVRSCQYAGGSWDVRVTLPGGHEVGQRSARPAAPGTAWTWSVPAQAIRVIPDDDPAAVGNGAVSSPPR